MCSPVYMHEYNKKITIIPFKLYIFLEDVQIIHGISLYFFKSYISKICNDFSLYIYDLEFN